MELQRAGHDWAISTLGFSLIFIIYCLLCWVFLAAWVSSSCCKQGLLSSCDVWTPHCCDASCGSQAPGAWASAAAAQRLSSCGSQAPEHRLNSFGAWAWLHQPGIRYTDGIQTAKMTTVMWTSEVNPAHGRPPARSVVPYLSDVGLTRTAGCKAWSSEGFMS